MSDEKAEPEAPSDGGPTAKEAKKAPDKPAKKEKSKPAKEKKAVKAEGEKAKGKKAKGKKGEAEDAGMSVAAHPRAGGHVRQAKGWGGLIGFGIAAYLSMHAAVPTVDIGIRALAAGAAGYLLAWACSVTVWRHLMMAELRVAAERRGAGSAEPASAGEGAGNQRRERA